MAENNRHLTRISSASAFDQAKKHKFTMYEQYARERGAFIDWKPGEREELIAKAIENGKVTRVPAWQKGMSDSGIYAMNGTVMRDVLNEARERQQSMMEEWG